MGYSYTDSLANDRRSKILELLTSFLQEKKCASMDDFESIVNSGRFELSSQQEVLYWVDRRNEIICISFPAILNLEGQYGCLPPSSVNISPSNTYFFHYR